MSDDKCCILIGILTHLFGVRRGHNGQCGTVYIKAFKIA